jgi:hypothetical protein
MAMKISTCTQTLLQPDNLNLRIVKDLDLDPIIDIAPIDVSYRTHDLINDLLQANCTNASLEALQQNATDQELSWTVCNKLLLFNNRLVVLENDKLKVCLLSEAHNQVSTAHPGQGKTLQLI